MLKRHLLKILPALLCTHFLGCASEPQNPLTTRTPAAPDQPIYQTPPSGKIQITEQPVEAKTFEARESYFDWPVDSARLTRGFLPNKRKPHLGIDLAAAKGTKILAAHDGTVIYTGREFRGYGKMVMIEGSRGWATLYAHFSEITIQQGAKVRKGEQIGLMGRTGHATGNHLHFELRSERGPVDPLAYLPNGALVARLVTHKSSQRNN